MMKFGKKEIAIGAAGVGIFGVSIATVVSVRKDKKLIKQQQEVILSFEKDTNRLNERLNSLEERASVADERHEYIKNTIQGVKEDVENTENKMLEKVESVLTEEMKTVIAEETERSIQRYLQQEGSSNIEETKKSKSKK